MRQLLVRTVVPVAVVAGALSLAAAVLVVISADRHLSRDALAAILMGAFPLNMFALIVVLKSAAAPPKTKVLDAWIEQFLIGALAGALWFFIGIEEVWPVINTGFAETLLISGILYNLARPILFLRHFWFTWRR